MTTEGFKYQLSSKVGDHMLNVRADDADEFRGNIDDLFGEGASTAVLTPFFVTGALSQPAPAPVAAAPVTETVAAPAGANAPSPKQVSFAKQLGIDPSGHTKKSLSAAIDAKLKG